MRQGLAKGVRLCYNRLQFDAAMMEKSIRCEGQKEGAIAPEGMRNLRVPEPGDRRSG